MTRREMILHELTMRLMLLQAVIDLVETATLLSDDCVEELALSTFGVMSSPSNDVWYSTMINKVINARKEYELIAVN